jgi:hypothetical protein
VARAKTTYRADARRRYRAARAAETTAEAEAREAAAAARIETPDAAPPARRQASSRSGSVTPAGARRPAAGGERPSLLASLRIAAAPADVMGDIRAFPTIARTSKAVWVPALLDVASAVALFVSAAVDAQMLAFLGSAVLTPPMIPAFLAGMLAPRASWLAGGVAGIIGSLLVATYIAVAPAAASVDRLSYVTSALVTGILFSFLVGAFAGFYRRFLALSAPPPRQGKPGAKTRSRGR